MAKRSCQTQTVGKTNFWCETNLKCWLYCCTSPTLSYGYGLEPVQLPQQTGAFRRMKAINKLLGSPGRVEWLHGLFQRVCPQVAPLHQHEDRRLWGEPAWGWHGGCLVLAESGSGQPCPGSQRESGPQDSPQAGQHLWDGSTAKRREPGGEQWRMVMSQAWWSPLSTYIHRNK